MNNDLDQILQQKLEDLPAEGDTVEEDTAPAPVSGEPPVSVDEDEGETPQEPVEKTDPVAAKTLELAVALGYNPDYEGENKLDPETFILRQKEFTGQTRNTNKQLKRELDKIQKQLAELQNYQRSAVSQQAEQTLEQLQKEWEDLVSEGRVEEVKALQKRIDEVKARRPAPPENEPDTPGDPPEMEAWKEDNPWYDDDPELQQMAFSVGQRFAKSYQAQHGQKPPLKILLASISKGMAPLLEDSGYRAAPAPPPTPETPSPKPAAKTNGKPKPTVADVVVSRPGGSAPVTLSRAENSVLSQFEDLGFLSREQFAKYKANHPQED